MSDADRKGSYFSTAWQVNLAASASGSGQASSERP